MPRILVIEDNPASLELMSYLLGAFGYAARTAVDGRAGLEAAFAEPFDLIICDVQLSHVDGYEIARRLKADGARRATPVVAVTALAMVGDRERVLAAGFDGYISKPIDPELFVRQVEEYLGPEKRRAVEPVPAFGPEAVPSLDTPADRVTVLAVDNLPVNLDLARSLLEPRGYRVLTAEGLTEALAVLRRTPCDMILSDVCMTDGSGYDFIRAVKADQRLKDIPFVFLTSTLTNETDRATGLALGASRFLFRPVEPDALLSVIVGLLIETGRIARADYSDRG